MGTYPGLGTIAARAAAVAQRKRIEFGGLDPQTARQEARKTERARAERARLRATVSQAVESWLQDAKLRPSGEGEGRARGWNRPELHAPRTGPRGRPEAKEADRPRPEARRSLRDGVRGASDAEPAPNDEAVHGLGDQKGLVTVDLTAGLTKEKEGTPRSRTLADEELRALVTRFDGPRHGRAVSLLVLTGCRRDEVIGARWEWIDLDTGVMTIRPESEKAGREWGEPREVALSSAAVSVLKDQLSSNMKEGLSAPPWVFATATGERLHGDGLKPTLNHLKGRRPNG